MKENYLLTIAIPTYNRSKILDNSLSALLPQVKVSTYPIELIVSDNCSPDNTSEIVLKYVDQGYPIRYIKNSKNLGMDGNFVQCFKLAQGKYVWVLGDDDYLLPDSLSFVLQLLARGEYGLVHLLVRAKTKVPFVAYTNSKLFLSDVSYWVTFISSNIVNTKYVYSVDFEKYIGTFFTLVPLYMTAAIEERSNCLVYQPILDTAKDAATNGGYNYFEIFIKNYLTIWYEYAKKANIGWIGLEKEKHRLFKEHIQHFMYKLLFCHDCGNFSTKGAWSYFFSFYWYDLYIYPYLVMFVLKSSARGARKLVKGRN